MAETEMESQRVIAAEEREKLDRLLSVFNDGVGIKFGDGDIKKPVTFGRETDGISDVRRVTINDSRKPPVTTQLATQRVKTFYVDSWPEVTVKMDSSIIPNEPTKSARAKSMIGGTPITRETAIDLRMMTLGTTVHSFSTEWRKSSLLFYDISSTHAYGLQTSRCGAKSLILCVQAYLLKNLLFTREYVSSIAASTALTPSEFERRKALSRALCDLLWQAGDGRRCCVCLQQEDPIFDTDYRYRTDSITEKIHLYEFKKFQDLQIFMKRHLSHFEHVNSNGCILILYSLIMSRTIPRLLDDMDSKMEDNPKAFRLLNDQEEPTIALMNLMLTGRAVKHIHNGNMVYNSDGKVLPQPLRGVRERSQVGFLFWDKNEDRDERTEVGSMLKTPKNPIWLTHINGQYGLLFSTNPDLVSDWRVEHRFVLYYYTGLSAHRPTPLTIVTQGVNSDQDQGTSSTMPRLWRSTYTRFNRKVRAKSSIGRRYEEQKTPSLEQCIMTKWYGAEINWNGVFPYI